MVKSKKSKDKTKEVILLGVLALTFLLFLGGCSQRKNAAKESSPAKPATEASLILNAPILEQTKENGELLWKVKAITAKYTKDNQIADVESPEGELYQDGKLVFRIKAKRGQVQQDGKKILLNDEIVATDIESGAVSRGDELEWRPEEDILIIRKNFNGTHKQLDAFAKEGRIFSRKRQMELIGDVVAVTKEEPFLNLRTEQVLWDLDKEQVMADRPVQIDRYEDQKLKKLTDRAVGKQVEVNLKTKVVTLKQNAKVILLDPPLEITSELITWNIEGKTVNSNQPVQLTHSTEKLIFTGQQGKVDIDKKMCYLNGDVQGYDSVRKSQLRADELTWNLTTSAIEGKGNIIYRQIDPAFTVNGTKAYGKLNDQTVTVTNEGRPVVTEIVPPPPKKP